MEQEQAYKIIWQEIDHKEARILRVYTNTPEIILPGEMKDYRVVEIAPYCFSAVDKRSGEKERSFQTANFDETSSVEFCGSYIEAITLPDTLVKIERSAFYNCKKMRLLSIGKNVKEIGSDAFMNCFLFRNLVIRANPTAKTALKFILNQISSEIVVSFAKDEKILAEVLFPEYFEAYDEIAPAHVFGRKITGEGFRARQSFKNGVFDFAQYDLFFPKACIEEDKKTLAKIALARLFYPILLTIDNQLMYESYIREEQKYIMEYLISKKNLLLTEFLFKQKYVTEESILLAIASATYMNWTEGTASLLFWKSKYYHQKKSRYDFDEE